jgi:hypothetical protein
MPYQHKKRKIRRERRPDRVVMAKRKRARRKAEHTIRFAQGRHRESVRQTLLAQLREAKSHPPRRRIKLQLSLIGF